MGYMDSAKITASGVVTKWRNVPGKIGAVTISCTGDDVHLQLKDAITNTGTIIFEAKVDFTTVNTTSQHFLYVPGINYENGIWAQLAEGTSPIVMIYRVC